MCVSFHFLIHSFIRCMYHQPNITIPNVSFKKHNKKREHVEQEQNIITAVIEIEYCYITYSTIVPQKTLYL